MNMNFDDIRPYNDSEIPAAMRRIVESEAFSKLATYVFPDRQTQDVAQLLLSFKTISDFQWGVMHRVNERIMANSISHFSFSGVERLSNDRHYLFVSNHRDIMLDASLLQNVLADNGLDTAQITFGANLMMNQLVVDIGKSNKMFRVDRPGGSAREFYKSSLHLSQYIRHTITESHESVWIAQRNGRTKDGNDHTDQGLVKMFCMSLTADKVASIADLNVVPVAVSYEWEPCDVLKTLELYKRRDGQKYVKRPGEDLNSILTGILQQKGRVHFELCPMITADELRPLAESASNEFHKQVSLLIDRRITSAYRLWPNNFIAYDLRHAGNRFADRYTAAEREAFEGHLEILKQYEGDQNILRDIMTGIYANPVENAFKE